MALDAPRTIAVLRDPLVEDLVDEPRMKALLLELAKHGAGASAEDSFPGCRRGRGQGGRREARSWGVEEEEVKSCDAASPVW